MRRVGIVVLLMLIASACQHPWFELASRDIAGDGARAHSSEPALSANGRFVAFSSDASDLVAGDTNGLADVFVRDLQTGSVELVSVGAGEVPANGASFSPSISGDGNRVVFSSRASNLAPHLVGSDDVFVHDRAAGTTVSASIGFNFGDQSEVGSGAISGDGSTVWFRGALRLGTFVSIGLIVYDVATGGLSFPPSPAAFPVFLDDINHGAVSHDGRYAAVSTFTLPAPEVTRNVYRVDRVNGTGDLMPEYDNPFAEAGPCTRPAISGDGNVVAFECESDKLVAGVSAQLNAYARDMTTGTTFLVAVDGAGAEPDGASSRTSVNTDGTRIAFTSFATNLVPFDTNGVTDVFVRDLTRDTITRVSLDTAEVSGNHSSPSLGDGEFVAFTSDSNEIVPGDADITRDVLVRSVDMPTLLSATPSGVARGTSETLTVAGDFFQPDATVSVSGGDVTVDAVVFVSPSQLDVTVTVAPSAITGLRQLSVLVPGPGPGINGRLGSIDHCKCVTIT